MRDTAGRASTERRSKKASSLRWLAGAGILMTAGAAHAQTTTTTTNIPDPRVQAEIDDLGTYVNEGSLGGAFTETPPGSRIFTGLGSTVITSSVSVTQTVTLQTAPDVIVSASSTEVLGNLIGRGIVFDQTIAAASGTDLFNASVQRARAAISAAGAPLFIRFLAPRQLSTSVTSTRATVTRDVLTGSTLANSEYINGSVVESGVRTLPTVITSTNTFGPATINFGFLGVCTNAGTGTVGTPGAAPSGCTGGVGDRFQILPGQLDININDGFQQEITRTSTTTVTTQSTEVWEVDGIAALLGTIHAVVPVAGFDQSEGFATRTGAQAAEATGRFAPWIEGWGQFDRTTGGDPAAGVAPGDTRNGYGLGVGASFAVNPMLRVGVAADHGHTDLRVAAAGERGSLDLTQVAGFGRVGSGTGPYIGFGGGYGWGHDRTSIAPAGATATASSRETVHLYWASGELGYRQGLGAVAVTPLIGATFTRVTQDGFVETGSTFNLASSGATNKRVLSWAGLRFDARLGGDAHPVTLALLGRATHLGGDRAPTVAVGFAGSTGDAPLLIAAPLQPRWGADLHAAMAYRLAPAVDVFVASEADLRDGDRTVEARGGVRMHF